MVACGPDAAAHVVVKTSAWPYSDAAHDAHYRDLSYPGLPAVLDTVAQTAVPGRGQGMNSKVIITCALTGAGDTSPSPSTCPSHREQIAEAGIEAARAGAASSTSTCATPRRRQGSREVALYREVVERIRARTSTSSST